MRYIFNIAGGRPGQGASPPMSAKETLEVMPVKVGENKNKNCELDSPPLSLACA